MITLDNYLPSQQNEFTVLNSTAGFDRLEQIGRQSAYFDAIISTISGIFTSVKNLAIPFSMVSMGLGGFTPAGSICQSVNPDLLLATKTTDSVAVVTNNQIEKVSQMNSILKALSRPLSVQYIRTYPTLSEANQCIDRLFRQGKGVQFNLVQTAKGWELGRVA